MDMTSGTGDVRIVPGNDPEAVERILRALPAWFGIESAIVDYVAAAGELPGYLAVAGGAVVGAILLRRHTPTAAEVHLVAVDPAHHRRGVGRGLLTAAETGLAADGVRFLQVKTLGTAHPSEEYARTRRFYESTGFVPLEETADLWPGHPCLIMVKTLADRSGEAELLLGYLRAQREAVLWKLDGLGERDLRRPLTPTGTNLLGLVKHLAGIELGYFGEVFGRPFDEAFAWMSEDAEDNADMWATAEEPSAWVTDLYRRAGAHTERTVAELGIEGRGRVPWWSEDRRDVTVRRVLVHVIAETARHAGHADVVRELIDGAKGMQRGNGNLPGGDERWWREYRGRLEAVADAVGRAAGGP